MSTGAVDSTDGCVACATGYSSGGGAVTACDLIMSCPAGQ